MHIRCAGEGTRVCVCMCVCLAGLVAYSLPGCPAQCTLRLGHDPLYCLCHTYSDCTLAGPLKTSLHSLLEQSLACPFALVPDSEVCWVNRPQENKGWKISSCPRHCWNGSCQRAGGTVVWKPGAAKSCCPWAPQKKPHSLGTQGGQPVQAEQVPHSILAVDRCQTVRRARVLPYPGHKDCPDLCSSYNSGRQSGPRALAQ